MRFRFSLLIGFLCAGSPVRATDYFVSSWGRDQNAGTSEDQAANMRLKLILRSITQIMT